MFYQLVLIYLEGTTKVLMTFTTFKECSLAQSVYREQIALSDMVTTACIFSPSIY
jgi:hypothetical protein